MRGPITLAEAATINHHLPEHAARYRLDCDDVSHGVWRLTRPGTPLGRIAWLTITRKRRYHLRVHCRGWVYRVTADDLAWLTVRLPIVAAETAALLGAAE